MRQNVESFLSQMQYIISLNPRQSWKTQSVCVCLYYLQYTWCSKDDSAICCASLLYILTSRKVCITCQSLAHTAGTQSKLMEGLHLHFKCYTLHDNLKTKLGQINASKCSVVLRNKYRTTPNF